MLDLGTAPRLVADLSVFDDHADPDVVRALPDRPVIVADPDPLFSLILYRGRPDEPGRSGGLLQLEVDLSPSTSQLKAVRQTFEAEGRFPRIVPPNWLGGRAIVMGWLAEEGGVASPVRLAETRPSLIGWPRVAITAMLDAAGASLASAALSGDALPAGILVELEFQGLSGALDVVAEADLAAVHDRLTANGALTTPLGRARLSATWEELAREGVVRIEVLDQSGDVEARRGEALRRVAEDLTRRLLSPVLPDETPPLLTDGAVAPIEVSFRLTTRREELVTTSRWDWRERQATTITHHAAAMFTDLLGDRSLEDVITRVDLAGVIDQPLRIVLAGKLEPAGLSAIEVEVATDDETRTDTVVLTPEVTDVLLDVSAGLDTVRFRVRSRFDRARTDLPDDTTQWRSVTSWVIVVDPEREFPPRRLVVATVGAHHDAVVRVNVPGATPQVGTLAPETSREFHMPGLGGVPLDVTVAFRGWPGGEDRDVTFRGVTEETVIVPSPFATETEVTFVPVLDADVVALTVELQPGPEQWTSAASLTWEAPDGDPVDVRVRRLESASAVVPYQVTTVRDMGATTSHLRHTVGSFAVVGSDSDMVVRRHRLESADGGPMRGAALLLELVLTAGDVRRHIIVDDDRTSTEMDLVVPVDAPVTWLLIRAHLLTGEVRSTVISDPGPRTLLPPDATGGLAPPAPPTPPTA